MEHASDLSFEDEGPKGHAHPSVMFYNLIAVSLFVVTALEVGVLYPPLNEMGTYLKVVILVLLSLGKFAIVVAFFMHLFFDAPLLTFLFAIGMVIGTGTVVALIHVMPAPEHELQPVGRHKWEEMRMPGEPTETPHASLDLWRQVRLG